MENNYKGLLNTITHPGTNIEIRPIGMSNNTLKLDGLVMYMGKNTFKIYRKAINRLVKNTNLVKRLKNNK